MANKREAIKDRKVTLTIGTDNRRATVERAAAELAAKLANPEETYQSPSQEADAEFLASQPAVGPIVHPRVAAEQTRGAIPPQAPQGSITVADIVYGVYSDFKKGGMEQNSATGLTIAYALLELAVATQGSKKAT